MKGRLHHTKQVMWHSIHHGWSSAHGFHYQVVRDIEVGNITWCNLQEMQALALAAAEGSSSAVRKRPFSRIIRQHQQAISNMCTTMMKMVVDMKRSSVIVRSCMHAARAINGFLNKHRALDCRKWHNAEGVHGNSDLAHVAKTVNSSDSVLSDSNSAQVAKL